MAAYTVYTDGACSGNPGRGGWGVLILSDGAADPVELCGGEPHTTNNRMELLAAISALEELPAGSVVTLWTDSQYVRNGISSWMAKWKRNGWRTAALQPVKNVDLWQRLDAAASTHQVEWRWVRGHVGVDGNERADELARRGMAQQ